MKQRSAKAGILIGVVISAALLVYLLSGLEWTVFFREMKKIQLAFIVPLFLLYILSSWIRAKRWHLLLPGGKNLSTRSLFNACVLGNLASYALPLRAGEFVRPWVLSRSQPISFAASFASVVTERVFDVLAMLTLLGICLFQIDNPPPLVTVGAQILAVLALGIASVMLLAYFKAEFLLNLAEKIIAVVLSKMPQLRENIMNLAREFVGGLRAISSGKDLLLIIIWSYVLWLEFAFIYHIMLLAFGENPSLWVSQVLNVMIALAIAAPSAPGFIGTFQFGCVTALTGIYGYSQEFALAYSVFSHSLQVIFTALVGILCLKNEGLHFGELKRSKSSELAASPASA